MNHRHASLAIVFVLICAVAGPAQNTAPKSPCPRELAVGAPFTINEGDPLTFAVEGPDTSSLSLRLKYEWTISPPSVRLISGAGTPSITVETAKMNGKRITVNLAVEGMPQEFPCRVTADASTMVVAPRTTAPPHKFAEFPSTDFNRDKEQLDRLATFLSNSPEAGAYLIAYGGRTSRPEQANRLGARARNYLLKSSVISGIDPNWVAAVNGGRRERETYEIWIVPRGAQPPQPTPTIRPAPGKNKTRLNARIKRAR